MLPRPSLLHTLSHALKLSPVVALAGPRQCGKTTLARQIAKNHKGPVHHFDLENPGDAAMLAAGMPAIAPLRGLVVIDEVQRAPALFPLLRVLADRPRTPARFLILGSASPELIKGASESLAGRITTIDMAGFRLAESGDDSVQRLWLRGGFPRSYLAASETQSTAWRAGFIRTFLERDIPQLGISIPAAALQRFWTMCAHYHGQTWNAAEFARSLGASEPTARHYLDILTGSFVVRQLQPWHQNISKRQVRSPKVYVRDTGLLHALLGVRTQRELWSHPKLGASWEGFAIEQLLAARPPLSRGDAYCWGTQGGAELDLLVFPGGKPLGIEIKATDTPGTTKSMRMAIQDLGLSRLWIVHGGKETWKLGDGIEAVTLVEACARLGRMG